VHCCGVNKLGLFTKLLEPQSYHWSPFDDRFFGEATIPSASGVRITPQTALTISTVFACVRIISQTLAMLPLIVYERKSNGGKERAPNHPLFDVLHVRPNIRQTSFQFREMMMGHVLLRGNAYAQIIPGPRGFVDQLIPLHPDRIKPSNELASDGSIRYEYRQDSGQVVVLLQDEVFHISGLSDDGIRGLSLTALAKDSFGLAAATEQFGNRFFSGGQAPMGNYKMPGKMSKEGYERLKADLSEQRGGLTGSHKIGILEEGLEWQSIGLSNEDSQFLETRLFQVEEIAAWFGVPLALLQHTEKSTSWGTGIAQLTLGFVQFTMQPWLTRWEQEIDNDLILNTDRFFAEFVLEGLLRGDHETRAAFYAIMIDKGIMMRNEVRKLENLNPLDGLDEPAPVVQPNNNRVALKLAGGIAARMARREVGQIRKAATKNAGNDIIEWERWVAEFYDGYKEDLIDNCALEPSIALAYSNARRDELLAGGVAVIDEKDRAEKLVALMIGED
jgi:HK97 family phage portal protein